MESARKSNSESKTRTPSEKSEIKSEEKEVLLVKTPKAQVQVTTTTTTVETVKETKPAASAPPPSQPAPTEPAPAPAVAKPSLWTRLRSAELYIDPFERFYYSWLIIVSVCCMYNIIFIIARTSFWLIEEVQYHFIWHIIDYGICDLCYLVDIGVRFFTGFMENGELNTNKKKIAVNYLKSFQFKIDFLSILPIELFWNLLTRYEGFRVLLKSHLSWISLKPRNVRRVSAALRLNRLLRYGRFMEFRNITETKTKYPTVFRMSNLLINILIAMHWNACIYFLVSYLIGFGHDKWVFPRLLNEADLANLTEYELNNKLQTQRLDVQYIYCFWWSALTLTTVAEVPEPENHYQEIYMSILLMSGVIVLAITIGSAGDMVENANRRNLELQVKCDYAKSFLTQNRITGELETRIKNYLDYLYITPDLQGGDVIEVLPYNLRKEIAMSVHIETLKRVKIFQDCEPGLLEELVTKLKLQIYSPGDYVCRKGDVGYEMYFIKMGSLQVVSPDGTQVYATLGAGAAFGEISILDIPGNKNGNKRTANIRSFGFSDVFQLSKSDLWAALSEFPVAKKTLMEKGKALLRKDNLLDEEVAAKVEHRQKPIHEQIEYFQVNDMNSLNKKLDDLYKSYTKYLSETNQLLKSIEFKLGIRN